MSREVCGICWCPYDEDTGECACKVPSDCAKHQPVAWLFTNVQSGESDFCYCEDEHDHDREMWHRQPLYLAPPQRPAEPEQEPVAKVELMMTGGNAGLATRIVEIDDHLRERLRPGQLLYTAPPQRKPLSGLEVERLLEQVIGSLPVARRLVRAIERAHGIGEKK